MNAEGAKKAPTELGACRPGVRYGAWPGGWGGGGGGGWRCGGFQYARLHHDKCCSGGLEVLFRLLHLVEEVRTTDRQGTAFQEGAELVWLPESRRGGGGGG